MTSRIVFRGASTFGAPLLLQSLQHHYEAKVFHSIRVSCQLPPETRIYADDFFPPFLNEELLLVILLDLLALFFPPSFKPLLPPFELAR